LSLTSFREAAATFEKESDRGSALIAVAWVDDALEALLKASFRDEKKIVDSVFQSMGPLSTFSARIKTAYLLGLVTASLYSDLERMRGIRNDFAHVRRRVRFKDQSIKDRCKLLAGAKAFEHGTGNRIRSPRQRFLISALFAAECLLSCARDAKRSRIPALDLYPAVIHRGGQIHRLETIDRCASET
jgi:Mannitol repressor